MKKIGLNYLIIAVFAIAAVFTSCDKDKDGDNNRNGNGNTGNSFVIDIKNVVGGYSEIVTVKVHYVSTLGGNYAQITTSEFKNGGCKLNLPNTVPADFFGHGMWSGHPRLEFSSDKEAKLIGKYHEWQPHRTTCSLAQAGHTSRDSVARLENLVFSR